MNREERGERKGKGYRRKEGLTRKRRDGKGRKR